MSTEAKTFDSTWEMDIYSQGLHLNRYPFDAVVSFLFRHRPRDKGREEVRVLEVGCGAGNNLWFAAREGFQVAGIDASPSALAYARKRFSDEGLEADLRVGDFTKLPFPDGTFDLAIDRCALTCCGVTSARQAVGEVARVLRPAGKFFCNLYSDHHGSHPSGTAGHDGVTLAIADGTLAGVGQLCFYGRRQVESLFSEGWRLLSLQHLQQMEMLSARYAVHAEWRVVAERVEGAG